SSRNFLSRSWRRSCSSLSCRSCSSWRNFLSPSWIFSSFSLHHRADRHPGIAACLGAAALHPPDIACRAVRASSPSAAALPPAAAALPPDIVSPAPGGAS
ncbi:unnamed protein product, partial [Gulo gulo]